MCREDETRGQHRSSAGRFIVSDAGLWESLGVEKVGKLAGRFLRWPNVKKHDRVAGVVEEGL